MNPRRITAFMIIAVLVLAWSACGGGGGGSTTPITPPTDPLPAINITTAALPDGLVGKPYSFTATAIGGKGSLSWSMTGAPVWASINASTGAITGTPTTSSGWTVTLTVTDSASQSKSITLPLYVYGSMSLSQLQLSGTKGIPLGYNSISVQGGKSPYTITASGVPDGLTFTTGSQAISLTGTPMTAGAFDVAVHVVDSFSPQQTADLTLRITIDSKLTLLPQQLPEAAIGRPYTYQIKYVNGTAPFQFSIDNLAPGLVLDPATGAISGTPTVPNNYLSPPYNLSSQIHITDSSSPSQSAAAWINYNIYTRPTFSNLNLNGGNVGSQYWSTITASGAKPPITYTLAREGTLPPGLNFWSGTISGTPTQAGTYSIPVHVEDSMTPPQVTNTVMSITVLPPLLQWANTWLPDGTLGKSYSATISAKAGTPPYTYSLAPGASLPPGLTFASDGTISGTPQRVGSFSFQINASDSASPKQSISTSASIVVATDVLKRNDTIATATPLSYIARATISPYADPVNIANPDTDYYKLFAKAGDQVSISVNSTNTVFDPVLELVDANGVRYSTCKDPGNDHPPDPVVADTTPEAFDDECLNDDIDVGKNTDSSLVFQVPGTTGQTVTFYAHVFDSRGDARPDMAYTIMSYGGIAPLAITSGSGWWCIVGKNCTTTLYANSGTPPYTWALAPGSASLPTGLSLTSSGAISGVVATPGTYQFTVQVTDTSSPAMVATQDMTLTVRDHVKIVCPSPMPQATTGIAYNPPCTISGLEQLGSYQTGLSWSPHTPSGINLIAGASSGIPTEAGTFNGTYSITYGFGGAWDTVSQDVTVTIVPGPIVISTTTLANGYVGWDYQTTLQASGGSGPLIWSVASGALPAGLKLTTDGLLVGVPTEAGAFPVVLQVTDKAAVSKAVSVTINILTGTP